MALTPSTFDMRIHPTFTVHICVLFRSIILYDFVEPNDFGSGSVLPLIMNKTGDENNVNNYRDITDAGNV